jgi:hypothetical protein
MPVVWADDASVTGGQVPADLCHRGACRAERARVRRGGHRRGVLFGVVVVLAFAQGCTGTSHKARPGGRTTAATTAASSALAPITVQTPAPPSPASAPPSSTPTASPAATGVAGLRTSVLAARLPAAIYRTQAAVSAGSVYLLGGINATGVTVNDVYRLDPISGTVSRVGVLAAATHGAAALTVGGRILVFGGAATSVHDTVQAFAPATAETTVVGRLPGPLADLTAAAVGNQILLLGGFNGTGRLDTVLASTDSTTFHVLAHLAEAVRYPAVAVEGTNVYLFGGLLSGGEYTGTFSTAIQRIDVATGSTTIVGRLPIPLAHAKAVVLAGHMLVLGGSTTGKPSAVVFNFDPAAAAISKIGDLPEPVTDGAVVTVGDTAYLLGGISGAPLATILTVQLVGAAAAKP